MSREPKVCVDRRLFGLLCAVAAESIEECFDAEARKHRAQLMVVLMAHGVFPAEARSRLPRWMWKWPKRFERLREVEREGDSPSAT